MLGVLAGFFVVWAVIFVGMFIGRRRILTGNAQSVLSALSFNVANPALLFEILSKATLTDILGPPLIVAAAATLSTALLCFFTVRLVLKRTAAESVLGATGASLANWGNLGIPIAAYVLGNTGYVAPLLVFQLAIFTPMLLMSLDATSQRHRTTPGKFVLIVLQNPMVVGSGLGLLVAGTETQVPELIMEPIHLIAGAAVPAMLLAFGMSLNGSIPLRAGKDNQLNTILASTFKLIIHPLLAFVIARYVLHLESKALFAAVIMAAMPTAQNAFVIAARYETAAIATKDTVLITTVIALPAMTAVALFLA